MLRVRCLFSGAHTPRRPASFLGGVSALPPLPPQYITGAKWHVGISKLFVVSFVPLRS